jgi:hypothetical protein
MTNPIEYGYLEDPYNLGQYLAINMGDHFAFQVFRNIQNETKAIGTQTYRNFPDKTKYTASQVQNNIKNYLDAYGTQTNQVIDNQKELGLQSSRNIADFTKGNGLEVHNILFKDSANATQVQRQIVGTMPPYGMQVERIPTIFDPHAFEIRMDKSFPHLKNCGYADFDYLSGPYLGECYGVYGPSQVFCILFKDTPFGSQANKVITWIDFYGQQLRAIIADRPVASGMQVNRLRASNIAMQIKFILYNTTNLRFMYEFGSRGVTGNNWTSISSAGADFNINNVNTDIVEQRWQTPNGTKFDQLVCDTQLPQGIAVDTVAILGHNLTTSATVTMESSSVSDFASIGETIYLVPRQFEDIYYIAPTYPNQQWRYWRITISDPTNPDNCLKIGTIIFGSSIVLQGENIIDQIQKTKKHFADKVETEGYTAITNDRALKKSVTFDLQKLQYARGNYENVTNAFDFIRTGLKALWIPDPKLPARFAVFGKLANMPVETHNNLGNHADYVSFSQIEVDESL